MGFLKHFRSKSKLKDKEQYNNNGDVHYPVRNGRLSPELPENVLRRIFTYVCPHATDFTYETSEKSLLGDGCMLCDLRDLSKCALVNRSWYQIAHDLLYGSVRIDAVHYCELEEILTDKRRRKSRFDRNGEPPDIPAMRLQLFCRTVRESPYLASRVLILKLPYMTRETNKADLARTVSVLPNLRYVDLPEGFFTGDPSSHTLRQELAARCPDIRKMAFGAGSEQMFEMLAQRNWQNIENLELSRLAVEPTTLRRVLGTLPTLHDVKFTELKWLDDTVFQDALGIPDFPPLQTLTIEDQPGITANGLNHFLERPETREVLSTLTLRNTGVRVPDLPGLLWSATHLEHLTIVETVTRSMPLDPLPPLTSITLKVLFFEISSSSDVYGGLQKPSDSYYAYLSSSLHSNSLPALRELYVRDPDFPETLLLAPPMPSFAGGGGGRHPPPPQGFSQTLEVYSKGIDETDWVFTTISPNHAPGQRGSVISTGGRPLSQYSASKGLGPQWGGEARRSVVVGNGFGGFLAVPAEEFPGAGLSPPRVGADGRPSSSGSVFGHVRSRSQEKRGSRADLWR